MTLTKHLLKAGRLLAIGLLACPALGSAAELVIPGSGNPEYVLGVLAREFNAIQSEHRVSIPPSSGSAGAIREVLAEKTPLGRIGRLLTPAEKAKGLSFSPIGRDAVVFVAGAGVTVRSVSSQQMVDAYTGKITDWQVLGGKPGPMRVIGRESTDSSRQAVAAHIKPFQDLTMGPAVKIVHLDPQVLDLLDRFETSLGILNRSALSAAKTRLTPLSLEGIEATPQNLASGRYPMFVEMGLIQRTGTTLPPEARAFVDFIRSAQGNRILRDHGISPAAP